MARSSLRIPGTIARDLGIKIVSGKYRPGTVLEGEVAASVQRQVSRSAYREAVRILTAKGLVDSRPKKGTKVSERAGWHLLDPDVLSWIFAAEPDDALVEALFELRRIVEPEAAALAARRRTKAQMERMQDALTRMEEHTLKSEQGRLADQEFHATLLAAAGNAFLVSLTSGIGAAVAQTTLFKQQRRSLRRDPVPDHQKVLKAVAARDAAGAHAAMMDLLDLAFTDTAKARRRKAVR